MWRGGGMARGRAFNALRGTIAALGWGGRLGRRLCARCTPRSCVREVRGPPSSRYPTPTCMHPARLPYPPRPQRLDRAASMLRPTSPHPTSPCRTPSAPAGRAHLPDDRGRRPRPHPQAPGRPGQRELSLCLRDPLRGPPRLRPCHHHRRRGHLWKGPHPVGVRAPGRFRGVRDGRKVPDAQRDGY